MAATMKGMVKGPTPTMEITLVAVAYGRPIDRTRSLGLGLEACELIRSATPRPAAALPARANQGIEREGVDQRRGCRGAAFTVARS
jgi:hypothetical protein